MKPLCAAGKLSFTFIHAVASWDPHRIARLRWLLLLSAMQLSLQLLYFSSVRRSSLLQLLLPLLGSLLLCLQLSNAGLYEHSEVSMQSGVQGRPKHMLVAGDRAGINVPCTSNAGPAVHFVSHFIPSQQGVV